jgi:hypothetical protein
MKLLIFVMAIVFALPAIGQDKQTKTSVPDKNKEVLIVEASCGQCKLSLPGKSCDLAIRLNGKSYFVDGTNINDHGDAHADDGFCNSIRKAEVQGTIVNKRFKSKLFQTSSGNTSKKKPAGNG